MLLCVKLFESYVVTAEYCNIRVHHECEGGIEKIILWITDWHYKACRVLTNGDREGRIFLSHPHANYGLFFLLTTKYLIFILENMKKASKKSWIILNMLRCDMHVALWRYLTLQWRHGSTCRLAGGCLFYLSSARIGTGFVR